MFRKTVILEKIQNVRDMEMDLNFKANNILKGNIYAASITAG